METNELYYTDFEIPGFLKKYISKYNIEDKCKCCEHFIVVFVDPKRKRGSGACYCNNMKFGKRRYRYFSDPACPNFILRKSSLEPFSGGEKEDRNYEYLRMCHSVGKRYRYPETCTYCHTFVAIRDEGGSIRCNCKKTWYRMEDEKDDT